MPCIYLSYLIAMARASNTVFNRSGESEHPCLVLILVGKLKFLPIEYDVGCRSVVCGLYYVEECLLYSHFAKWFYHKWVLYLIKCFFLIYGYDLVVFCLLFCLCDVLHLLICKYCTILASLE